MVKKKLDQSKRVRPETLELRPVSEADRDFLLRVYADARRDELERTNWPDEQKRLFVEHQFDAQTRHYREVYPASKHLIINWNDEPVGRLFISSDPEEIAILDVTVLEEYRGRGIGTRIIESLTSDAAASQQRVRIYVEFFNPSGAFFQRRGFEPAEQDGIYIKFVWSPG